jgi:phosphotransferase system enzyme I (PtsI)
MEKIQGNIIFEGIVIAKPYVRKKRVFVVQERLIDESQIEIEVSKVEEAIKETRFEIKHLIDSLKDRVNKEELKILNVQLLMLDDPVFLSDIIRKIKVDKKNAEYAVDTVLSKFVNQFKSLSDPVYRERSVDVQELGTKIIQNLLFEKPHKEDLDGKIIITKELEPFELLKFYNDGVDIKGIITELGGETSHSAILCKALGIPTLMGVNDIVFKKLDINKEIVLDARLDSGKVIIEPNNLTLSYYQNEVQVFVNESREIEALRGKEVLTKDNERIYLKANLGGEIEITQLSNYLPDGVGLLRTEFIYMDNDDFPSENRQVELYQEVYDKLGNDKPLTIRTLDIGGDKQLSYFKIPEEANPFLGLRAIRLCLKHRDMFKTQLRAILRVAHNRNIKIMYPMISKIEELWEANKVLEEAKKELLKEKIPFAPNIEIGMMIEVPSSAIMADIFIKEVDFFSIGTNDLTQYVMAADRLSKEVSDVYDKYDPAVLRMVYNTARAAIENNKSISVCGEVAGEAMAIIIFLAFGIKELSMLPALLPKAKKVIKDLSMSELAKLREPILKCRTSKELKHLLKDYY